MVTVSAFNVGVSALAGAVSSGALPHERDARPPLISSNGRSRLC
jgi:hypothetical protein